MRTLSATAVYFCCFFFFSSRRRHTRLQGDWSSDVCSSDLVIAGGRRRRSEARLLRSRGQGGHGPVPGRAGGRGGAPAHGRLPRRQQADRRIAHLAERAESRGGVRRSEEHTSELQSPCNLVCRLLLEKKKIID